LVTSVTQSMADAEVRFVKANDGREAKDLLQNQRFEAVIMELHRDEASDFVILRELHKTHARLPIIVVSQSGESQAAIEAIKAGAFDFLPLPPDPTEVRRVITEAIDCSRRAREPVAINPRPTETEPSETLIGNSRAMLDVYKQLGRLSPTPVTVLIRGETGTGKELVARALYQHGHRAHKSLITVNCAAIPENLLESELFGHEKGAFTGAVATRIGKFEQAHGATLFLDEIGDLDHSLQAKLLRILQEKRFQRVGGSEEISVDVRVIAATHRNIEKMIQDGLFREDLFYRLNVGVIKLPPLRDRTGDIPLLVDFFLRRFSGELGLPPVSISRKAITRLESATLPGNVRQLQNIIRKALLRSRGFAIDEASITSLLDETEPVEGRASGSIEEFCREMLEQAIQGRIASAHDSAVEKIEAILIDEALSRSGGNISQAAKWLGLSRLTLREKAKKFGVL
jgi:DNA-binding NtrC family response regulator